MHVMHSSHLEWSVGGQRALPRAPPTPLFSRCSRHLLVTMICSPGRTDTPRLTRDAGGVGVDFGLLADVCVGHNAYDVTLDAYFDQAAWAALPALPPRALRGAGRGW